AAPGRPRGGGPGRLLRGRRRDPRGPRRPGPGRPARRSTAVIALLAVACVSAGVWILSLPPPAALRLTSIIPARSGATSERASGPRLIDRMLRLRDVLSGGRRDLAARRAAIVELCDGIAAELAAGRPPGAALSGAAEGLSLPRLESVVDAARSG